MADNEPQELTEDEKMLMISQFASKVQTTINTPGWTEIIKPELEKYRKHYLDALLSRQNRLEDVMFYQQSVLAIDDVFGIIKFMIDEGKGAVEYFKTKQVKGKENV